MVEVLRRPGVSADEVETVLRLHLDRVHDAVRRLGADRDTAVEVVESSAVALVDAVAARPAQVTDAAGWWFGEARRLAHGLAPAVPDLPLGGGVLSADDDQLVLAEAVEELPEQERLALLMRDAYRLPMSAVAVALGTDEDGAGALVARARLHAVPLLDDEPAPPVPAHAESLPALARLGEGGRTEPRWATAKRHVQACPACAAVVQAQERVHLLLSGLAVVAPPEAERTAVLARVGDRARALLPAASALVLTEEEWDEYEDERRLLPPLLVVLGVLLAVGLGTGLGVLLSRPDAVLPASSDVLPAVTLPPVEAPAPIALPSLPPPPPVPTPRTTVFFVPPATTAPPATRPPATATPTPEATETATPPGTAATLRVDPGSGPNGTRLTVTGTGWTPASRVVVEYLDAAGRPTGSRATATVDEDGAFREQLVARDPAGVPGRHTVRATDGRRTASAPFDQTP